MATEDNQPNLFELAGDKTRIVYSPSDLAGQPKLSYTGPAHGRSFSGEEIGVQRLASDLGTLVTVTLEQIPDLHTVTYSMLLPDVSLDRDESRLETQALETTHQSSIGGTRLVRGALQNYRAISLRGTARFVHF